MSGEIYGYLVSLELEGLERSSEGHSEIAPADFGTSSL